MRFTEDKSSIDNQSGPIEDALVLRAFIKIQFMFLGFFSFTMAVKAKVGFMLWFPAISFVEELEHKLILSQFFS